MKNKSEKKKPKGADKSNSYTQHFKSLYDKRIADKELKDKTFPVAKY
jgi:hypothetical protein